MVWALVAICAPYRTLVRVNRIVVACLCAVPIAAAAVFLLWPASHGISDQEMESLRVSLLKKSKPTGQECRRPPLFGATQQGPGSELLREALDPAGPFASCYGFSVAADEASQLMAPSEMAPDQEWASYWAAEETNLSRELRSRCDPVTEAVAKSANYESVCSPYSLQAPASTLRSDVIGRLNTSFALTIRNLVREGKLLAGAELATSVVRAWQDLGRGEVPVTVGLIAATPSAAHRQLESLINSQGLQPEERALVHQRLQQLLASQSSASEFAMGEENSRLLKLRESSSTSSTLSKFALVAIRDARSEICPREATFAKCIEQWRRVGSEGLPESLSIRSSNRREDAGRAMQGIAQMRAIFLIKAAQGYAALLALELSSRSLLDGSPCPAEQKPSQLGVQLVVSDEAGRVTVSLPSELVIHGDAEELLSFQCPGPAPGPSPSPNDQ